MTTRLQFTAAVMAFNGEHKIQKSDTHPPSIQKTALFVQRLTGSVDGYHLKDQPLGRLRLALQRVLAGEKWITQAELPQPRVVRESAET